jgi:hypothetical protein
MNAEKTEASVATESEVPAVETAPPSPHKTPKGQKTAAQLLAEGVGKKVKAPKAKADPKTPKAKSDKPRMSGWAALKQSLPDAASASKRLRDLEQRKAAAEKDKSIKAPSDAYILVIKRLVSSYNPNKKPRGKAKKEKTVKTPKAPKAKAAKETTEKST